MLRVAIYIRVSTEEQKLHGLSVDAQKEILTDWVKSNGYIITDYYIDAGLTARKQLQRRRELLRLLEDIKCGKIDLIIFTKLDRWFRNIPDYYKVQEVIDKYHVNWKTILEDYDTSTANGRLHINIMLSIAQDEADRTSERIKTVFHHKIELGECLNSSVPFGYTIVDKRYVINDKEAPIVQEIFNTYELKRSILSTQRWFINTYSKNVSYEFISKMLKRELYIGKKGDNDNYCTPIISKEQFDRVNATKKKSFSRLGSTGAIYIFSGLVYCATCNKMMSGNMTYNPKPVKCYICRRGSHFTNCTHNKRCRESIIESLALDQLKQHITTYYEKITPIDRIDKKSSNEKDAIKRKLKRLKDLYLEEVIDMDQYKSDYDKFMARLSELEAQDKELEERKDISDIIAFISNSDYKSIYYKLNDERKRLFWHRAINKITITDDGKISIIFY